ncbi:MAG: hypothetical protein KBH23_00550 [Bacteroidaceae bacterium]|nr:hypothetical protein [Bacteroidaceae bacterium]
MNSAAGSNCFDKDVIFIFLQELRKRLLLHPNTEYFKDTDCITCTQFQKISFSTRSTATHQLDTLVEEGRLIRIGTSRMPYYQPAPRNYHK